MLRSLGLGPLLCAGRRGRAIEREPLAKGTLSSSDEDDAAGRQPQGNREEVRALAAATLCMVAIGHCQYTWTLFVESYQRALVQRQPS